MAAREEAVTPQSWPGATLEVGGRSRPTQGLCRRQNKVGRSASLILRLTYRSGLGRPERRADRRTDFRVVLRLSHDKV